MPSNSYWAYGLRICTEIVCPELPLDPSPDGEPDVTFRMLPSVEKLPESLESGYFETRPGLFRMVIRDVAHYQVEEGARILVEPVVGASPEEVRLFLLGSALGALLYQRGMFPLHGSTVVTRWGAMIFVGGQGAGKSTLAAQFHRRGYSLLSDDVCAIVPGKDGLEVLPALAQFRLCSDAYERLGAPHTAGFHIDKFLVPMNEGYYGRPVPLKAIHLLVDLERGNPEFDVLRGFERVQCLLENLYRPEYLKGQQNQSDLMRLAGRIAERATVARVLRRRDPEAIGEIVCFLETVWEERFGSKLEKGENGCVASGQMIS